VQNTNDKEKDRQGQNEKLNCQNNHKHPSTTEAK